MLKKFWMLLAFLALLMAGCQEPAEEEDEKSSDNYVESSVSLMNNLKGYWESSYPDGFRINGDTLPQTYYQYDDDGVTISFAGTIVGNEDDTKSKGFITIKITNGGTWGKTVGYYLVIRWKNLSGVNISAAAASNYPTDLALGKSTKKEAELSYTEANGYFSYYGDYIKQ